MYIAAGIGMAEITRQGPALDDNDSDAMAFSNSYEMLHSQALNFPVQLGGIWHTSYAGIGLAFVANINRDLWDVGAVLTAHLGSF
jgi:hypothetical protein